MKNKFIGILLGGGLFILLYMVSLDLIQSMPVYLQAGYLWVSVWVCTIIGMGVANLERNIEEDGNGVEESEDKNVTHYR